MKAIAHDRFCRRALTLAMLAAIASAVADEEVDALVRPDSSASAGLGFLSNDAHRFGMYSGVRDDGVYGLVDLDVARRDDASGTWMTLSGRNLGLDNRELRFDHLRQGDWGYFVEFSQTPRHSPYTVNTGLSGIGGTSQRVNGDAARDVELKTEREAVTLGFDKQLPADLDFKVSLRNEEKDGSRLFGRTGTDFLAEPINSVTRLLDATLGYTGERLQLSGGYFGSWYDNHHTRLDASGGTGGAFTPIGLPPDNESHQLHLAGGYSHTPTTRSTFKFARARTTQNDAFIVPSITGDASLDGRVDTTQAQLGISSRPIPKLSLLANVRYEDRDDKTPVRLYSTLATGTSTFSGFYEPRSIETSFGKLEAGYQLPLGFGLTGGVEQERKERNVPYWMSGALAAVSTREETEETTLRVLLRRSLSETVNGSLSYAHSERDGSEYSTTVLNNGSAGSNLVAPLHLADRERDLWRLALDWAPLESLALQLSAEHARDEYSGRILGLRDGKAQNYSLDATWMFSDDWRASAWLAHNNMESEQTSQVSAPTGQFWSATLRNLGQALGGGVRGKFSDALELGADLQYSVDRGEYLVNAVMPAGVTPPPDVHYRVASFKLHGRYALTRASGVKANYVYERWSTDDWTWTNWVYSDGTRVTQDPKQRTHFVGLAYYYGWR